MEPLILPDYNKGQIVSYEFKNGCGELITGNGRITTVYDSLSGFVYVIGGQHLLIEHITGTLS